jgi:hypothetical protein
MKERVMMEIGKRAEKMDRASCGINKVMYLKVDG